MLAPLTGTVKTTYDYRLGQTVMTLTKSDGGRKCIPLGCSEPSAHDLEAAEHLLRRSVGRKSNWVSAQAEDMPSAH